MDDVVRFFSVLLTDDKFLGFQNDVVEAMYGALGEGYAAHENEVSLVTRLVEATDGMAHGRIRLFSRKIHGPRSYVEFFHRDRPITKELGDSVYITVVTRGRQRVLQRVCFVQNKVAGSGKGVTWKIDEGQLFLLKNFPRFSGNRGIFKLSRDVIFRNPGGCLGAYGLFAGPGEMVFASAPLIEAVSRGRGSVPLQDLAGPELTALNAGSATGSPSLPWFGALWHPKMGHPMHWDMLHKEFFRFVRHHGFLSLHPWGGVGGHFLGHTRFAADIHDFAKAWLLCNLGEISLAFGEVVDPALEETAVSLLMAAGAGELFDVNQDVPPVETGLAVYVAHFDVGEE